MALDNYDFSLLTNETEKLVLTELERQLNEAPDSICRCNECVVDMACAALNTVRPLYHHSLMGALYTAAAMEDAEYANELRAAVAAAIKKVARNPEHNEADLAQEDNSEGAVQEE
jgi:competence protein ComFB